jgi:hypothetical protein
MLLCKICNVLIYREEISTQPSRQLLPHHRTIQHGDDLPK